MPKQIQLFDYLYSLHHRGYFPQNVCLRQAFTRSETVLQPPHIPIYGHNIIFYR